MDGRARGTKSSDPQGHLVGRSRRGRTSLSLTQTAFWLDCRPTLLTTKLSWLVPKFVVTMAVVDFDLLSAPSVELREDMRNVVSLEALCH